MDPHGNALANSSTVASRKRTRVDGGDCDENDDNAGQSIERVQVFSAKRIANACTTCRTRKTKCNGVMPSCSYCADRGILCQYQGPAEKRIPNSTDFPGNNLLALPLLEDISLRLQVVELQLRKLQASVVPSPIDASQGDSSKSLQKLPNYLEQVNHATSLAEPFSLWWDNSIEDTLRWSAVGFSGSSHRPLEALINKTEIRSDFNDLELTSPAEMDALVREFLDEVHTKNPILDPVLLQLHVTMVKENGVGWDSSSCLVLLVCALGASSCKYRSSSLSDFSGGSLLNMFSNKGRNYHSAATKRLGALMHRTDLISVQCQFLSGVYLMYNIQPWVAWKTFHLASVSCYSYLIRNQIQSSNGGVSDISSTNLPESLSQRLYWSCIKSEIELAHEFHLPVSPLKSLEYPHPLPDPPSSMGNSSRAFLTTYYPQTDANLEVQSWYYYLTEISLRKLELEIDEFFVQKSRERTQQTPQQPTELFRSINNAVMGFDERLFACWQNLPPSFSFSLEDIHPCETELQQYLRMKMMWIRHDLCRISLYMILHHDLSQSTQLQASFTNMAKKGLSIALQFMNIGVNSHRNHGTWFGIRLGVRSALELIAARRSGNAELIVSEPSFVAAAKVLSDGLNYWKSESDDVEQYLRMLGELDPVFIKIRG